MQVAPVRVDEAQSLSALSGLEVLDTGPEAQFDALVRVASLACGTPIALLSLVDRNRQWFKANIGLPGFTQTPRDIAFCAHGVLGDDLLEVPDAQLDSRFADNPLVTGEPHVRFYAGAPIRLNDGYCIGTLCVVDHKPRQLDEAQRDILRSLALMASSALEARRALVAAVDLVEDLYDNAPCAYHSLDAQGTFLHINATELAWLGCTREDVIGKRQMADFLTAEGRALLEAAFPKLMTVGRCEGLEFDLVPASGAGRRVGVTATATTDADGNFRTRSVMFDVTERRAAELLAARQTATLVSVTEAIPGTVAIIGSDGLYRYVNGAFERWSGLPRERIVGCTARQVLGAAEFERHWPWVQRALAGEPVNFVLDYLSRDGPTYVEHSCIPLRPNDSAVDGFVVVTHDVTQQKLEESRLLGLAEHDPLTGLLNRTGFERYLDRALAEGNSASLALLYVDLDHFKPVNDQHGHPVGDHVLQAFAKRLMNLVRPTDAVSRLGGDEFAIALLGIEQRTDAELVADKVLSAAKAPFRIDGLEITIGASVGVAFEDCPVNGWQDLVKRADAKLLVAKAGGRGRQVGAHEVA
ncbi:diguanylate cyclase domain-containing protein [Paucibacter sp. Y2R2-4]|uniref:bifunctional diguanylate cyclase/phosphodiesterase n=1 Tax=Paucibacter sp. Y2R2-4 TaxID=2893553 RepID=UPI0021E4C888|nr:diguanylate cyclase [Paucibacter sp. Y2R2-4]MCV2351794.1 diguanylate cyclase [Paucibacter sp. Y2R2-4]